VGVGSGQVTGGIPWVTSRGSVHVNLDTGRVSFDVKGLVLAFGFDPLVGPGVPIGTPGPVTQVKGTLVCDVDGTPDGGNSVDVDTPATTLDSEGNAQFSGISSAPCPRYAAPLVGAPNRLMDVDRSAASRHLKTASQVLYPALRFPTRLPLGGRERKSIARGGYF
jgi:hypothetical protein